MSPFPQGTRPQAELLDKFFAGDGPRWLLWADGLRWDTFEDLHDEYLSGRVRPAWNHDLGYTGDWADRFLRRDFDRTMGFFSSVPLWEFEHADYDEREYFGLVPAPDAYDDTLVADRLEALGYTARVDRPEDPPWQRRPLRTNAVVRDHLADLDGGVVRYIAPHPPLVGLDNTTSGRGKIDAVHEALATDVLTTENLREAYRATARVAFEAATDLIPDLSGEVVLTADHGECLSEGTCSQIFHARGHDTHDHLTTVPWARVDGVVA